MARFPETRRTSRLTSLALAAALAISLIAASLTGCTAPQTTTSPGAPRLVVVGAADGVVAAYVAATGAPTAIPARVGPGIEQLVLGPRGSVLTVSRPGAPGSELIPRAYVISHLTPDRSGGWTQRTVSLPSGAGTVHQPLIAAGGERWMAAAYRRRRTDPQGNEVLGPRCTLALFDGDIARASREHTICRGAETVSALAVKSRGEEAIVYAALTDQEARDGRPPGKLVALNAVTGEVFASVPLWGVPASLVLAPAPWASQPRLYSGEWRGGPEHDPPEPYTTRLSVFQPETLTPEASYALDLAPPQLAVSPQGDTAYLLEGFDLLTLDLRSGHVRRLARLPERGLALAVDGERAYVATTHGSTVLTFDRLSGARRQPIRTARGPIAIALTDPGRWAGLAAASG